MDPINRTLQPTSLNWVNILKTPRQYSDANAKAVVNEPLPPPKDNFLNHHFDHTNVADAHALGIEAIANHLQQNINVIEPSALDKKIIAESINIAVSKFKNLSDLDKGKSEWIYLNLTNNNKICIHFDIANQKIGFYETTPSQENIYAQTHTDSNGNLITNSYFPCFSLYNVKRMDRLKAPDFLDKLRELEKLERGEDVKRSLINYLKAESKALPPPVEAPYFYLRSIDNEVKSHDENLLNIALGLQGKLSKTRCETFFNRYRFLNLLDQQINDLNSSNYFNSMVPRRHRLLNFLGNELKLKNALSETEIQAMHWALINGQDLEKYQQKPNSVDPVFLEPPSDLGEVVFHLKSEEAQPAAPALPADRASKQDFINLRKTQLKKDYTSNVPVDLTALQQRNQALKSAHALISNTKTLNEGLAQLITWCKNANDKLLPATLEGEEENIFYKLGITTQKSNIHHQYHSYLQIARAIAVSLPILCSKDLEGLDNKQLEELSQSLFQIAHEVNLIKKYIRTKLSSSAASMELHDTYVVAATLLGQLSTAILMNTTKGKQLDFPLNNFVENMNKGVFIKDPQVQKKAEQIVRTYFQSQHMDSNSTLFNLRNTNSPEFYSLESTKKYFLDKLPKQLESLRPKFEKMSPSFLENRHLLGLKKLFDVEPDLLPKPAREMINGIYQLLLQDPGDSLHKQSFEGVELDKDFAIETHSIMFLDRLIPITAEKIEKDPTLREELVPYWQGIDRGLQWSHSLSKVSMEIQGNITRLKNILVQLKPNIQRNAEYNKAIYLDAQKALDQIIKSKKYYETSGFAKINLQNARASDIESLKNDLMKEAFMGLKGVIDTNGFSPARMLKDLAMCKNAETAAKAVQSVLHTFGYKDVIDTSVKKPKDQDLAVLFLLCGSNDKKKELLSTPAKLATYGLTGFLSSNKMMEVDSVFCEPLDFQKAFTQYIKLNKDHKVMKTEDVLHSLLVDNRLQQATSLERYAYQNRFIAGYRKEVSSNFIANQKINEYDPLSDFYEFSYERIPVNTIREFAEICTVKQDQVLKTLEFIQLHPHLTQKPEIVDTLESYFYNFQTIDHLVQLEQVKGSAGVISAVIPAKLNKLIDSLNAVLSDPTRTEQEQKSSAATLTQILTIAIGLKKYLTNANSQLEDGKRVDLSNYRNYSQDFFNILGKNLSCEIASHFKFKELPEHFFKHLTIDDMVDLNPEGVRAVIFFYIQAQLNYRQAVKDPKLEEYIQALIQGNQRIFREYSLLNYFTVHLNKKVPVGLAFDEATNTLEYQGKTVIVQSFAPSAYDIRSAFDQALAPLGINVDNATWYLNDLSLNNSLTKQLGKSLDVLNIKYNSNTRRYEILGTHYSFDANRNIYFELEGRLLKYQDSRMNPLTSFGVSQCYNPKDDFEYADEQMNLSYILHKGKVSYKINRETLKHPNVLIRTRDGAVCCADKPKIWNTRISKDKYIPYSYQSDLPPGEYKFIRHQNGTRLESITHPGYYLSTNELPFNSSQITPYHLLANAEGAQILICPIKANPEDAPRWAEFTIENGRFDTMEGWDLLGLLLQLNNHQLIYEYASKLHLSAPTNDFQNAIAEKLKSIISDGSLERPEEFKAWSSLVLLDRTVAGVSGGLSNLTLDQMGRVIKSYFHFKDEVRLSPIQQMSSETERLFLNELRNWFDYQEKDLNKELKETKRRIKKTSARQHPAERLLNRVFTPFHRDVLNIRKKQLHLRWGYKNIFRPSLAPSRNYFQSGKIEKIDQCNIVGGKLTKIKTKINQLTLLVSDVQKRFFPGSNGYARNMISMIEKLISDTGGKIDFKEKFSDWNTLKANYAEASKEDFVNRNLHNFYYLLTSPTTSAVDRKNIVEWLELVPKVSGHSRWLSHIGQHHKRYPTIPKLVSKHQRHVDKLAKLKAKRDINLKPKDGLFRRLKHLYASHAYQKCDRNYLSSVEKSLSIFSIKKLVSFTAKNALTFAKLLNTIVFSKPLKLKNKSLQRPYTVFKKTFASDHKKYVSPVRDVDRSFDTFFTSWKSKLLTETAPLSSRNKLNLPGNNPITALAKKEIDAYRALPKAHTFGLKPEAEIAEFEEKLHNEIANCHTELQTMKAGLLMQANAPKTVNQKLKQINQQQNLSWESLIKLVHKKQVVAYQKHLIDPAQAASIEWGVYRVLAVQSRLFQMERVQASFHSAKESGFAEEAVQKLGEQLSQKRVFDGSKKEDLNLLFFEYASPLGMFNNKQYLKIKELGKRAVEIAQMPPGFGKTTYLIPTIADYMKIVHDSIAELDLKAKGKFDDSSSARLVLKKGTTKVRQLLMHIWPSAIAKICHRTTAKKVENATQCETYKFHFSREEHLDSAQLEHLLVRMESAARKGHSLNCSAKDVASLLLHWTETMELHHKKKDRREMEKRGEMFGRILRQILSSSFSTIDECRDVLDPLQKTIYTLGDYDYSPEYAVDFAIDFWNILSENEAFRTLIETNQMLLPDDAEAKTKEIFSDVILKKLANKLGVKAKDFTNFKAFLSGSAPLNFHAQADEEQLYLAKGYYTIIFKACIAGRVSEHFGLSRLHYNTCKFAIPYEKKDVPKENELNPVPSCYKNLDETIFKTLRVYHVQGLSKENLIDLIEVLTTRYLQEKEKSPNADRSELPSYRALSGLFTQAGFSAQELGELFRHKGDALRSRLSVIINSKVVNTWTKDSKAIAEFVKHCAMTDYKLYPETTGITPQDLLRMFKKSLSLSATPQQKEVHSTRSFFNALLGEEGKMFDLILSKTTGIRQIPTTDEEFVNEIAKGCHERNVRAISDPCGLKSLDRDFALVMAEALKKHAPEIKHIVYFDAQYKDLVRLEIHSSVIQPYKNDVHTPDDTLTLYSQPLSVGADIRQSPKAKMISIINSDTLSEEKKKQAAGRMRQLDKAQTLEIWDVKKKFADEDLQTALPKLLTQLLSNELQTNLYKNKVALQQMMSAELKGTMIRKMLGLPTNLSREVNEKTSFDTKSMLKYYKRFRNEFIEKEKYSPKESYGPIGKPQTAKYSLKSYQSSVGTKFERYFGKLKGKKLKGCLRDYNKLFDMVPLPKMDYGCSINTSQEMVREVAVSVQASVQKEVSISIGSENMNRPPHKWSSQGNWPKKPEELQALSFKVPKYYRHIRRLNGIHQRIDILRLKMKYTKGVKQKVLEAKIWIECRRLEFIKSFSRIVKLSSPPAGPRKLGFIHSKDVLAGKLPSGLYLGDKFFSDNLLLSSNYNEFYKSQASPVLNKINGKHASNILLIMEPNGSGKNTQAVLLDSNDTEQLHTLFELDRLNNKDKKQNKKFALYNLDLQAVIDQGKNQFTTEEIDSPEVAALTAQARMFSGRTNFSENEKKYLKSRILKIDKTLQTNAGKGQNSKANTKKVGSQIFANLLRRFNPVDLQINKERFAQIL